MNIRKLFLLVAVTGMSIALAPSHLFAQIWAPTDINTLNVNLGTGDTNWDLYMMDAGDTANPLTDLYILSGSALSVVHVNFDDTSASIGSDSLYLGTDLYFEVYFYNTSTDAFSSYTASNLDVNLWQLDRIGGDMVVTMHDVNPIPIPSAALLLATGLIGLIGYKRHALKR